MTPRALLSLSAKIAAFLALGLVLYAQQSMSRPDPSIARHVGVGGVR